MKKTILIAIILVLFVFAGIGFVLLKNAAQDQEYDKEEGREEIMSEKEWDCINSEGNIVMASCCKGTGDLPNTCLIGACGCSPENSGQVKTCDCGPERCFDGNQCVMPMVDGFPDSEDHTI